jgi:hypothetical protein
MGLGDMAKKWAKDKATELLSADRGASEAAGDRAEATAGQARDDLGERLLRTAFPKLGEWQDKQEEDRRAAAETADRERREEIASLPVADVSLTVSGWANGQWSGPLHVAWNEVAAEEPDPEYRDSDPYAHRPMLWVELFTEDAARPSIDGHPLVHWGFQVPGWTGDGTYDLTAIAREREAAGAALTYEEWVMEFADFQDSGESSFYFYSEAGASRITIAEAGKRLSVVIAMSGAIGDLTATAEITRR